MSRSRPRSRSRRRRATSGAGRGSSQRLGTDRRRHVEAVSALHGASPIGENRANAGVERVRRARDPGQRERRRGDRSEVCAAVEDDAVLAGTSSSSRAEARSGLRRLRGSRRTTACGGTSSPRLVRGEHESRGGPWAECDRGRRRSRRGRRPQARRGGRERVVRRAIRFIPLGCRQLAGRCSPSNGGCQQLARREDERVLSRAAPASWTYGGSASAGQPSALNGYVNIVPGPRIVELVDVRRRRDERDGRRDEQVDARRAPPRPARGTPRARARPPAASPSVTSRQRSILPRTFSPYSSSLPGKSARWTSATSRMKSARFARRERKVDGAPVREARRPPPPTPARDVRLGLVEPRDADREL